jgi:hypothetical protein
MAQAGRPRSDAALMAQLSAKLARRNSSGRHHQTAVGTGGSSRGGSARSSAVEVVPSNSDPQFGVLVKTLNYLQTGAFPGRSGSAKRGRGERCVGAVGLSVSTKHLPPL